MGRSAILISSDDALQSASWDRLHDSVPLPGDDRGMIPDVTLRELTTDLSDTGVDVFF